MFRVIIAILLTFKVEASFSQEWTCKGTIKANIELRIKPNSRSFHIQIVENNNILLEKDVTKFSSEVPAGASQRQIEFSEGNLLKGGLRIRIVQTNRDFPQKKGQGHLTFRHKKKMRNDVVYCPDLDSIADAVRSQSTVQKNSKKSLPR